MISPENVSAAAAKREDENLRFRTFLKNHADPDELDRQFLVLHKELFAGYDCCRCGNCCRAYGTILTEEEIVNISTYLGLTRQKFLEDHLIRGQDGLELPEPCRLSKSRRIPGGFLSKLEMPLTLQPEELLDISSH